MRATRKWPSTLDDLVLDPHNANRGTPRGRALLNESLRLHGAGRSVLVDKHGQVIAGNKTVEEARGLGLPIHVVPTEGEALVVVQRRDLDLTTDPSAKALAIRDNRVAELDLEWDPEVLASLRANGLDLDSLWSESEWRTLQDGLDSPEVEEPVVAPAETDIRKGDLFALGAHRLLCGDATDPVDTTALLGDVVPVIMCTDPPYGVTYNAAWRHEVYPQQRTAVGTVRNDDQAAWPAAFRLFPGDVIYAWHAGVRSAEASAALVEVGFALRAQIIWVKPHFVLSRGAYHYAHEPCFYAVRNGASAHWRGGRTQTTVWTVPNLNPIGGTREGENAPTGHSTQKPVRLFELPILNHTVRGDAVYDPFVGSGTTLIAAERTGRVAYVMDLEPRYVQATVTRWETLTGRRAKRLRPRRGRS
jgi:DNA modification methylase